MQPTDAQRAIRDQFRRFMTDELEPATPAFEEGRELPYELMKRMVDTLGLGAAAGGWERAGDGEKSAQEGPGTDPEMRGLLAYARTQLTGP
ncbi:MAG: acyl-CoA dehydrogenase family protein [Myxococcales bacterium]|nr:acyl-CoA dehydrogenase family protein [Myxococcales bacterium]